MTKKDMREFVCQRVRLTAGWIRGIVDDQSFLACANGQRGELSFRVHKTVDASLVVDEFAKRCDGHDANPEMARESFGIQAIPCGQPYFSPNDLRFSLGFCLEAALHVAAYSGRVTS